MYDIILSYFLLCYYIWNIQVHAASAEDFCRYELHTSKLTWDKAYQACKQRGMSLVSLSGTREADSLSDHLKTGESMYDSSLDDSSYWIGLHMESSSGGSSEFHWGDCVVDTSVTGEFSSLTDYSSSTGCGYYKDKSVLMTTCHSTKSMGFICEGLDVCFTTYSSIFRSLGFSGSVSLASPDCSSSCLARTECAGFYVSSDVSCTLLSYDTDLPSSLQASDLMSSYFHHKRFVYHGQYSRMVMGLNEDELCNISVWAPPSPIVTTTVSQETSVEEITPTPVDSTTTKDFDGETTPNYMDTTTEDFDGETIDTTTENTIPNTESVTVYNFSSCVCVCRDINDTLEERLERIKSGLTLDKKALSSDRNRRISAEDPRPSSRYVGFIGIFVLCIFGVLSIGVDILRIVQHCDKKHKSSKSHN